MKNQNDRIQKTKTRKNIGIEQRLAQVKDKHNAFLKELESPLLP